VLNSVQLMKHFLGGLSKAVQLACEVVALHTHEASSAALSAGRATGLQFCHMAYSHEASSAAWKAAKEVLLLNDDSVTILAASTQTDHLSVFELGSKAPAQ
jgi:hypothetical protein